MATNRWVFFTITMAAAYVNVITPCHARSRPDPALDVQVNSTTMGVFVPSSDGGKPRREFNLELRNRHSVRIDLESDDIDPYLEVYFLKDGKQKLLDENDDYGRGLNSRIILTDPQVGSYLIRAESQSLQSPSRDARTAETSGSLDPDPGTFRLIVSEDDAKPPVVNELNVDHDIDFQFTANDANSSERGLSKIYEFAAQGGYRLIAKLSQSDGAAMAGATPANDISMRLEKPESDSPITSVSGSRSPLILSPMIDIGGRYRIIIVNRAMTLDKKYVLSTKMVKPITPIAELLKPDVTTKARFGLEGFSTSATLGVPEGLLYNAWNFDGKAGHVIHVDACSNDPNVRPSIVVLSDTVSGNRPIDNSADDPSTPSCESEASELSSVEIPFVRDGAITIFVYNRSKLDEGDYTVRLTDRVANDPVQ